MLINKETKKKVSWFGNTLHHVELRCKNIRIFIGSRDNALEVIFLMIYVLLQFGLVILISNLIVSIFVLLFLFFLSLERIAMHLKIELEKDKLTRKEEEINENSYKMVDFYEGIREERDKLLILNKSIMEQNKIMKNHLKNKR